MQASRSVPHLRLVGGPDLEPVAKGEPSTFDAAWACRAGMMKKRGDGSDKTRKLWDRAAKKVGSLRLLDALKRFLREEKEPACGYPGLSVWLNGERYDHWMEQNCDLLSPSPSPTSKTPEAYRNLLIDALGEPFVRSYLDPCTFHDDGYITPRTSYAKDKLSEVRSALKAVGIAGFRTK